MTGVNPKTLRSAFVQSIKNLAPWEHPTVPYCIIKDRCVSTCPNSDRDVYTTVEYSTHKFRSKWCKEAILYGTNFDPRFTCRGRHCDDHPQYHHQIYSPYCHHHHRHHQRNGAPVFSRQQQMFRIDAVPA